MGSYDIVESDTKLGKETVIWYCQNWPRNWVKGLYHIVKTDTKLDKKRSYDMARNWIKKRPYNIVETG